MTREFDPTDRDIINALQRDGRATVLDIAERTDVPATTVQKRLKRLNETDVISGYESRIDYTQLGYDRTVIFKLDVNTQLTTDADQPSTETERHTTINQLMNQLQRDPHIVSLYELTGEFDLLGIGTFPDTATMNERLQSILSTPGIHSGSTFIVTNTVLENDPIELVCETEDV